MTKLEKLQLVLTNRAFDVYRAMEENLDFLEVEFESHYGSMGRFIYDIRNYNTIGGLIDDLYKGDFSQLGICDEEDVDDLIKESEIFK
jgi:hypothetical protein